MSKLFDALTRSLLEKYPADWLNQLGLIHGEPVRVMNSEFLPEKMNRHRITREKMNRHRITRTPDYAPDTGLRAAKGPR